MCAHFATVAIGLVRATAVSDSKHQSNRVFRLVQQVSGQGVQLFGQDGLAQRWFVRPMAGAYKFWL